jgi:hypothetical protein
MNEYHYDGITYIVGKRDYGYVVYLFRDGSNIGFYAMVR